MPRLKLKNGSSMTFSHLDGGSRGSRQKRWDHDRLSSGPRSSRIGIEQQNNNQQQRNHGRFVMSNGTMAETWLKSYHENDTKTKYGGRDLVGYGSQTPQFKWPKGAKVALNFVINYEEGGESCLLHGDKKSEKLLSEIVGAEAYGTSRITHSMCDESIGSLLVNPYSFQKATTKTHYQTCRPTSC